MHTQRTWDGKPLEWTATDVFRVIHDLLAVKTAFNPPFADDCGWGSHMRSCRYVVLLRVVRHDHIRPKLSPGLGNDVQVA